MGRPIAIFFRDDFACALIHSPRLYSLHRNAAFNRADIHTEVTGHAFVILDTKDTIWRHFNGLMGGILTSCITAPTADTTFWVNAGFGDVSEVQLTPNPENRSIQLCLMLTY